jgi:Protein of unknown function (DUF1523)
VRVDAIVMALKLRRLFLRIAIAFVFVAPPIAFLDYVLPHHAVVRLTGTQVKRTGTDGRSPSTRPGAGRDIYYIFTEDIDTKKPHVFRNEDTGWGFPWYFKFNSADLQAAAQSIADERGTAIITYYGWRIQIFSLFPNVTKIVRAEPDARPMPWFNIAFFAVVIGVGIWLSMLFRRFRRKRP